MADRHLSSAQAVRPGEGDCWNKIGVRGDRSCPELATYIHCRNCPVYASAAAQLLDRPLPDDYRAAATEHFAATKTVAEATTESVVLFRVGLEWLALPTAMFQEIAAVRPIHSLPHRRGGAVLGLGNVRGELIVCVSLARALAIEPVPAAGAGEGASRAHQRLLVVHRDGQRIAFPVDEVHGVHRFHRRALQAVPATVARATAAHTAAVLRWREHTVGCLDAERLWATLNRNLA